MKAGLPYLTKSTWIDLRRWRIVIFFTVPESTRSSMTRWAVISTENMVERTPIASVTPKPRIGPVPSQIMMAQMISWTMCASMIVMSAFA